jgi:hypothetical protein
MVALIFLPIDSCEDSHGPLPSSFGQAVRDFRFRANRKDHRDDLDLFERVLDRSLRTGRQEFGRVYFFDVMEKPPRNGRPRGTM